MLCADWSVPHHHFILPKNKGKAGLVVCINIVAQFALLKAHLNVLTHYSSLCPHLPQIHVPKSIKIYIYYILYENISICFYSLCFCRNIGLDPLFTRRAWTRRTRWSAPRPSSGKPTITITTYLTASETWSST